MRAEYIPPAGKGVIAKAPPPVPRFDGTFRVIIELSNGEAYVLHQCRAVEFSWEQDQHGKVSGRARLDFIDLEKR